VSIGEGGSSPACSREEDGDGEGRRGRRTRRRGAEKTPATLLLHFPASVRPTVAERGDATRVQELAGGAGYHEREGAERREVVWEVAGDGVGSIVCSEGLFIGRSGLSRRWPVRGGLAMCIGDAGRGGLGSVLAGFGLGVGALWAGVGEITLVGIVQRAEGKRGGSGRFPSCLPCLTARVGAGEAGARPRGSPWTWLQG
jgi:hypothetical protein